MSATKSPAPTVGRRPPWRPRTTDLDGGDRSTRTAGLAAALGLIGMVILAPYAEFGVLDRLVTPGDAVQTAADIAASEGLFRSAVASLAVVAVLDIVVAAALFRIFAPVNRVVSMFAAWLRLAYTAVFLVGIGMLAGVLPLSGDPAQAVQGIDAYYDVYHAGLVMFGAHLMTIGYLAYRSATVPRVVGVVFLLAGAGYLIDRFGTILLSDYSLTVAAFTGPGEIVLAFWLLLKGVRSSSGADRPVSVDRAPAPL